MEPSVVVKVFRLLETLGTNPFGSPLGEAAETVGMPKPTVHRLLKSMVELGYVARSEKGHYQLTPRLDQIRRPTIDRRLLGAAEPTLYALHKKTGENVNLGVLRADRVMYLRVFESTHPLRRVAETNSSDPVHSTALGRSIAAYLDRPQRDALLKRTQPFIRRTQHTVTDPEAISILMDRVRRDGYAIERDETDLGVACYGAPVFGEDGVVVGAISLSAPSARCTNEMDLINLVRQAATRISKAVSSTSGATA